jgi:hypothetical protein
MLKRKISVSVSVDINVVNQLEKMNISPTKVFELGLKSLKIERYNKSESVKERAG